MESWDKNRQGGQVFPSLKNFPQFVVIHTVKGFGIVNKAKAREFQKNTYFCFIDYAKAFDCVDHNKPWNGLKEMGTPDHITCLLKTCMQVKKQQVEPDTELQTDLKLGKEDN